MLSRALLGMWLVLAPMAAPAQTFDAAVRAEGEKFLAEEQGVGLTIGVLRDGEVHFHGFGETARGGGAPGKDTAFEIGSISKTMTGLLLARAVLAGKASLDDDVRKYLDGAYPGLAFEGEPVRLVHLASMTSGLPDNLPDLSKLDPDPGRFKHAEALKAYGRAQFLKDLRTVSPAARPGENVAHSNVAAQLLIVALERIYGMPYDRILAREIEGPLGFGAKDAATGHDAEGRVAAVLPRDQFGYRYSAADMLRYAALQLDERDPAVALSHKGSWFTLDKQSWVGLGWIVSRLPEGGRQLRYSGGTWGFASAMMLWPEKKLAVILLANKASDTAQGRLGEIAGRIAAGAWGATQSANPVTPANKLMHNRAPAFPPAPVLAKRAGHGPACRFHPHRRFRQPGYPADRAPRARGGRL
ncbi:serine hydrolase domain-containing protein [Sphingomonas sp. NPDC092331]|jgi:CubicO group peptidase (beta-lactamase class C family)|uniref:serine hydrolase domain-containing protein n=1 Tax=unclassified Sphingomonas TaxID=196159 RepID=UPI0031F4C48A